MANTKITAANIDSTSTGITFADLTVDTTTLVVDASNNRVGVGTDSPSTKLDVNGAIRLTDSTYSIYSSSASAVIGHIGNTANDLNIYSSTAGHNGLRFHVNGILPTDNTGTIIDADADLGVSNYRFKDLYLSGTANVGSVSSGSASSASEIIATSLDNGTSFGSNRMLKLIGTSTTDNSRMGIHFTGNTGIGNGLAIIEAVNEDQSAGHTSLRMHTYSGSWNENNLVLKSGNVGIGENNPLNELHVNGNVHIGDGEDYSSYAKLAVYGNVYQGDVALLIKNDRYNDSSATASLIFEHRTHAGQGHAAKIICRRQSGYNESAGSKDAALDFYTAEGGTLTRHMVLNRSGQFGVGNNDTFDAYAHHVIQSDNDQKVLDIKQNNSTGRVLGLQYIPNGPDDTTDYYMVCSDSNTNDMFVFSNGNVANKNNSYGSSSDIKIKQNITDANSQWNDIKALQFKNYKLKTDVARYGEDNADTLLGLIAQDVETAGMNGLVYESKDEDSEGNKLDTVTKGVKYSVLYLKAVKALQEAIVKIEDLESRIETLEG